MAIADLVFTVECAADIISAIKFDTTGTHLATGDKGGRVVIFKAQEPNRLEVCPCVWILVWICAECAS
jgi:hypothetical protein